MGRDRRLTTDCAYRGWVYWCGGGSGCTSRSGDGKQAEGRAGLPREGCGPEGVGRGLETPLSWKPSSRKVKITPKPTVEPHTTPPRSPLRGPPLPRHSPLWACASPCLACFRDTHPGSG